MTKAGGWLPSADSAHTRSALDDPLLQQIENIQSFLRQARQAQRVDEVALLEENLRQLQDEYDQQQTRLAIALSQKLAEEESVQRGGWNSQEDWEKEESWCHAVEKSPDVGLGVDGQKERDAAADDPTFKVQSSPSSVRAVSVETSQTESPPRLRSLGGHITPPGSEGQNSSSYNPFDEDDSTPTEDDPSNPFSEDIIREQKDGTDRKSNPFDEDEPRQNLPGNPFGEDNDTESRNPFVETPGSSPKVSTNPFDGDEDDEAQPDLDLIEEELLLQQIDNIRAYIFDAKLSGRHDEVELLSENLRELQRTLQEQKQKKH